MIILICKFNFKVYEKFILLNEDNNYSLIVPIENISEIFNNNTIYINNKKYHYKIEKTSDIYDSVKGLLYKKISIIIGNYKMLEDYNYCFILRSNDTFSNMIIKFITGGFYG